MRSKHLLGLLLLIAVFFSCQPDTTTVFDGSYGYNYYPLEVGKYWTYKVDSLVILNMDEKMESSSFVKEEIVNTIITENGDTSYVLKRSVASEIDGNYTPTDVWKIDISLSSLIRVEENLRFMKLLFPIMLGEEWDGNLFDHKIETNVGQNTIEPYFEWSYAVLQDDRSITLEGVDYTGVVEVQQADHEDEINLRWSNELYAPNVGMIKREMRILSSQCVPNNNCNGTEWIDYAEEGFTLVQILVDHN